MESQAYEQFCERTWELSDLGNSAGYLSWDQEVCMPKRGVEARAQALGTLAGIQHEKLTDQGLVDLIEALPSNAPTFTPQDAFDYQILQKILPHLSGAGDETIDILNALITFCNSTYPRSTHKLQRMKRHLERTGFANFW